MTMSDQQLETRLRAAMRAVAAATNVEPTPEVLSVHRARPLRRPVLAAVAGVAAALLIGLMVRDGAGRQTVRASAPAEVPSGAPLPSTLDLDHPLGVFGADGTADSVAASYAASRFGSSPVHLEPALIVGLQATVRWTTAVASGTFDLRQSTRDGIGMDQWRVAASFTDGVDTSTVRQTHGHLRGDVLTSSPLTLAVDVPRPRGGTYPRNGGALPQHAGGLVVATASGPARGRVGVDVIVGSDFPSMQVRLLDGKEIRSITEFQFPLAMPEAWHTVAQGTWTGGHWELRRSGVTGRPPDPSVMACESLVGDGLSTGVGCGPEDDWTKHALHSVQRIAGTSEEALEYAQLDAKVAQLRLRLPDGDRLIDAVIDPVRPNGKRNAVFAVPVGLDVLTVDFLDGTGKQLATSVIHPSAPPGTDR